jgi:hypothetical protein
MTKKSKKIDKTNWTKTVAGVNMKPEIWLSIKEIAHIENCKANKTIWSQSNLIEHFCKNGIEKYSKDKTLI